MNKEERALRKEMFAYLEKKYGEPLPPSIQVVLNNPNNLNNQAKKQFELIYNYIKLSKNKVILDAGCGFGYFVSFCLKKGYNCYGYEVEMRLVNLAKELLKINKQDPQRITLLKKKKLPYPDECFDFISLHFVLDYVKDIPSLLGELKRILKKDGLIFSICPNYQCFYSPVYALFFIPWLPKKINRVYFKLMGRPNTSFLESLTFTTPKFLEDLFRKFSFQFTALGSPYWQESISGRNLEHRSNFLKFLIMGAKKLRLTKLLNLSSKFGFYTPLIYILRNKDS